MEKSMTVHNNGALKLISSASSVFSWTDRHRSGYQIKLRSIQFHFCPSQWCSGRSSSKSMKLCISTHAPVELRVMSTWLNPCRRVCEITLFCSHIWLLMYFNEISFIHFALRNVGTTDSQSIRAPHTAIVGRVACTVKCSILYRVHCVTLVLSQSGQHLTNNWRVSSRQVLFLCGILFQMEELDEGRSLLFLETHSPVP